MGIASSSGILGACEDESAAGEKCELEKGHRSWHRFTLTDQSTVAVWPGYSRQLVYKEYFNDNPHCFGIHGSYVHGADCEPVSESKVWREFFVAALNPASRAFLRAEEDLGQNRTGERVPKVKSAKACVERAAEVADAAFEAAKARGRL